jgi:hypothetical protein
LSLFGDAAVARSVTQVNAEISDAFHHNALHAQAVGWNVCITARVHMTLPGQLLAAARVRRMKLV